jgi:hypothetical protein
LLGLLPKIKRLLIELNEQLNFINAEFKNPIEIGEQAIKIILNSLENLKKLVLKHGFQFGIFPRYQKLIINGVAWV